MGEKYSTAKIRINNLSVLPLPSVEWNLFLNPLTKEFFPKHNYCIDHFKLVKCGAGSFLTVTVIINPHRLITNRGNSC